MCVPSLCVNLASSTTTKRKTAESNSPRPQNSCKEGKVKNDDVVMMKFAGVNCEPSLPPRISTEFEQPRQRMNSSRTWKQFKIVWEFRVEKPDPASGQVEAIWT